MSEVIVAQSIRMQILKLSYILKLRVNPITKMYALETHIYIHTNSDI